SAAPFPGAVRTRFAAIRHLNAAYLEAAEQLRRQKCVDTHKTARRADRRSYIDPSAKENPLGCPCHAATCRGTTRGSRRIARRRNFRRRLRSTASAFHR